MESPIVLNNGSIYHHQKIRIHFIISIFLSLLSFLLNAQYSDNEIKVELLEEIVNALESNIVPLYREIENNYALDETEAVAKACKVLGENYIMQAFVKYGDQLAEAVERFNFDQIEHLVKLYDELQNKLQV